MQRKVFAFRQQARFSHFHQSVGSQRPLDDEARRRADESDDGYHLSPRRPSRYMSQLRTGK